MALISALAACSSGSTTLTARPPPARAVTWHVQAGASSQGRGFQGLAYYPGATLTIDAGDTVTWSFPANEPHTVMLLATGPCVRRIAAGP